MGTLLPDQWRFGRAPDRNVFGEGGGCAAVSSGNFSPCTARGGSAEARGRAYHLTDKGHDLLPTLVALMQWVTNRCSTTAASRCEFWTARITVRSANCR
jgi:hypothetical protein